MFQAFFFILISFIGTIVHYYFLPLNDILKNADSFAYLQMASNLANLKLEGFGTGWFGFIYSLPVALFSFINQDLFFLAKIINLFLFISGGFFLFQISKKILSGSFVFVPLILYYLSSSLCFFNIQVLSENIYIPLFLALIYVFMLFIEKLTPPLIPLNRGGSGAKAKQGELIGIVILFALLYLTRAEAFIYLGSAFLVFFYLFVSKKLKFRKTIIYFGSLILGFFLLISPYIYYLHTITGEWGLTNKGSSNLRQANMRGIEKMDDSGFEKAVGELTPDKHHLIAGFAGGLKYDKSYSTGTTRDFLIGNPGFTLARIGENQVKLYSQNMPKILLGDYIKLAFDKSLDISLRALIILSIFVFLFSFLGGFYYLLKNKKFDFVVLVSSFFITASAFFTIFFVLDRYFIIFLPLAFIFSAYFLENLKKKFHQAFLSFVFIMINIFGLVVFYNETELLDSNYEIKKEAGIWLSNNYKKPDLKIMERWPIVTYYAGSQERWLTPYTNKLTDIVEYATYNKIDLFVVDSMDFATYRPGLKTLLEGKETYFGIEKVKEFDEWNKKVIIYKFK